jgi:endonuclease III
MKKLPRILAALRRAHGRLPRGPTEPFALVLHENVAYLADDAKRAEAFSELERATGLSPERLAAAPRETLLAVAKRGILAADRVDRLREIAAIALEEFGGDLEEVVRRPPKDAIKALRRFPGIGLPAAEKILLFSGRLPVLALESNGLRVLLRLGYGREEKSYAASYASAQRAAAAELPEKCEALAEAHRLLRRHGQEICRRSAPRCDRCTVSKECAYFASAGKRRPAGRTEMTDPHVKEIREVTPSADGCEDCLKIGATWVELRLCLICGHVGCCDNSPNRHATKHFHKTKHPVIRSFEPGENWRWCYVDEREV